MKIPVILAAKYRSLHGSQKEEIELIELFKSAKIHSHVSVARAIVSNHEEQQDLMRQIEMIQIALAQQENGILEEQP